MRVAGYLYDQFIEFLAYTELQIYIIYPYLCNKNVIECVKHCLVYGIFNPWFWGHSNKYSIYVEYPKQYVHIFNYLFNLFLNILKFESNIFLNDNEDRLIFNIFCHIIFIQPWHYFPKIRQDIKIHIFLFLFPHCLLSIIRKMAEIIISPWKIIQNDKSEK